MKRPVCQATCAHCGVTLVELLVCTGILLLLAGAVGSVLHRSRLQASKTACAANLAQLGASLRLYVEDNDGVWPGMQEWSDWKTHAKASFVCPVAPPGFESRTGFAQGVRNETPYGYALNTALTRDDEDLFRPRTDAQVVFPVTTVAVLDAHPLQKFLLGPDECAYIAPCEYNGQEQGFRRHAGGANYLFCDGHVNWHRPEGVRTAVEAVENDPINGVNDGIHPTFAVRASRPGSR